MQMKTRDFGEINIEEQNIIRFRRPILGFEDYTQYILLHDDAIGESFGWLQSTEEPALCFILMDPSAIAPDYAPAIPGEVLDTLGADDYECWALATVRDDLMKSTVNLRSPILINPKTRLAGQFVLEQDYPVRFPLQKEAE